MNDREGDVLCVLIIIGIIVLKLTGVIKLSWFWLLCPIWGAFLLGVVLAVALTIACIISELLNKRRKNNERY